MDANTFVGVWVNWNFGQVLGLTLTIPKTYGIILVATLALLVKWAGSRFWGIICFLLHHWQTNHKSHDGLHYQHQALLRSKLPETDFLWRLYEISWAWRSHVPGSFRRSFPLGILALTNLAAFVIAGIFSARVTVADGQALITGLCGELAAVPNKPLTEWTKDDWATGDALFVSAYNGYRDLLQYVQLCYATPFFEGIDARCKATEVQRIESVFNRNASCPFPTNICTSPAISMDSGLINANSHLGINLPPADNLQVRKVTTCAPLAMNDFSSEWSYELQPGAEYFLGVTLPGDKYRFYSMGPNYSSGTLVTNFTFVVSNFSIITPELSYDLDIRTAYAKNISESRFLPDPMFNRTDADVSILTLNNRVAYTGQVDDPFFQATLPVGGDGLPNSLYSNSTLTGMGCTEQYQFCNPNLPGQASSQCTPLGAIYDLDPSRSPEILQLSTRQQAIYRILRTHFWSLRLEGFVAYLRSEILVANKFIWGSLRISTPLPSTQWQSEVENLHNMTLAGLQLQQIYFAAVPNTQIRPGLTIQDRIVPRTDPDEQYICRSQRIRVTLFSSFNMFGIFTIITVSFIIIALDVFMPKLVHWLSRLNKKRHISLEAWQEDDILQIQRTALEGQGIGPWKDTKSLVPVTAGWDLRFRKERSHSKWKGSDSQSFDGFERLTTTNTDIEGDIELTKTPTASVMRL